MPRHKPRTHLKDVAYSPKSTPPTTPSTTHDEIADIVSHLQGRECTLTAQIIKLADCIRKAKAMGDVSTLMDALDADLHLDSLEKDLLRTYVGASLMGEARVQLKVCQEQFQSKKAHMADIWMRVKEHADPSFKERWLQSLLVYDLVLTELAALITPVPIPATTIITPSTPVATLSKDAKDAKEEIDVFDM